MRKEQAEKAALEQKIYDAWQSAPWQQYTKKELEKASEKQRRAMLAAAKDLDFDTAARLRDEWLQMEDKLQAMDWFLFSTYQLVNFTMIYHTSQ